jgi:transposase
MEYPKAVIEKAQQMEKLLKRVAAGEKLAEVSEDLGVEVDEKSLAKLQAKYAGGGETWEALLDGRFGHAQKANSAVREWLYERKRQNEELRAPQLAKEIEEKFKVKLAPGHVNYLLRQRGLTAEPGRPRKQAAEEGEEGQEESQSERSANAGIFFPGGSEGRDGGGAGS